MKSDLCTEREKCNFSPPTVGIKPKWLHDEHRFQSHQIGIETKLRDTEAVKA